MSNRCLRAIALIVTAVITGCGGESPSTLVWGQVQQALDAPTVTSFTPASGKAGTSVTVTGTGFLGVSAVRFNGTAAGLTVMSDTKLSAVVPDGATTGPLSITHPSNGTGTSAGDFTLPVATPPTINTFSPQYGAPGTSVTLEGANLSSATVQISGVTATPTSNTATQIVLTVPANARSGLISVSNSLGYGSSQMPFTVVSSGPPTLSSFSPASGARNTAVTLTGTHLATASEVTFNGVAASYISVVSDTRVSVGVPAGASTGLIRVYNNAGSAVSSTSFTVPSDPKITSFTPMSGAPGTSVTVTGENFPSAYTTNALSFNGVAATNLVVVSATRMTATVPSGATTGPLSFNSGSVGVSSVARFSVLSTAAPVISGFTPASGPASTRVTLTGSRFTGTREVTVNGVTATSLSLSGDTSLSFYVPTGTTTGPIRVFNTAGSTASTTDFTVTTPPPATGIPVISGFSPASGPTGTLVTLTGSGFTGTTQVYQGGKVARFTVIDDGQLSVSIPPGVTTGKFTVYNPSGSATSAANFTVMGSAAPLITSVVSNNGANPVYLYGAYFTGTTSVKFNGVEASSFFVQSDGWLYVYKPSSAFTPGRITVTNSEGTGTSPQDFVPAPPTVLTSLTPTSGPPGSTVSVVGSGFSRITSATLGVAASFKVMSDTQLEVIVPRATAASIRLVLQTPMDSVTSSPFTVTAETAPTISGFTPDTGVPNNTITVFGSGFSGASEVTVNGTVASSFAVQGDGQLIFYVPAGATTGPIRVKTSAGTATSSTALGVPSAPTVSGFTPSEGGAGTAVTITGTGFTYAQGVNFTNSRTANFYVSSDTELIAFVPGGAVDGPISVFTGGVSGTSTARFTVTSTCVPVVTSFSPARGGRSSSVAVTGRCFTGTSAVSFNGAKAGSFVVYSDTQLGANLPVDASSGPIQVTNTLGTGGSTENFLFIPSPSLSGFTPAVGTAGTVVTLSGKDLATVSFVSLNGKTASFSVVSDTQLAVTVPLGATRGVFSVYTLGGNVSSNGSFEVQGLAPPTVTSFSPSATGAGKSISLTGTNFTGTTAVEFDGVASSSFSVNSDTQMSVSVPSGARSGLISVENSEGSGSSATSFTVLPPPRVIFFSPASGPPGTVVTLEGVGFTGATDVYFGYTSIPFTLVSDTQLTTTVPSGIGTNSLGVAALGGIGQSRESFKVLSTAVPIISSFTPESGKSSNAVTVTGSGFTAVSSVTFNGVEASFSILSDTKLTTYVPQKATTGPIAVTNTLGTGVSPTNFTPIATAPLTITGFSPTSGPVGTAVTIDGSGFTDVSYFYLGGKFTPFTRVSDSRITAVVEPGASSGILQVSASGANASSLDRFTVTSTEAPVLASFTPATGIPGTIVTLQGTGFTGTRRVTFNGTAATSFQLTNDQTLQVSVPRSATPGPISVENTVGSSTSSTGFTVIPSPTLTGFTPTSGSAGTSVTLTGAGLSSISSVTFNGVPAAFTVDSATRITAIVPGGAISGAIGLSSPAGNVSARTRFDVTSSAVPTLVGFTPGSGPVGSSVLLSGTGFTGVTGMSIGGVAVSTYTVQSDTRLVVGVPYGATTGAIRVTNSLGTATSATSFEVSASAAISGFTPASGAAGTQVTLTGAGFTGLQSVLFTGGLAAFTVNSDTQVTATVPAGAVSGVITLTGPGGPVRTASAFKVPSSVAPTVTSFGPVRTGVRGRVTVSGSHFADATEVRVNGVLVESFEITSDNEIRAVLSAKASTGVVSVTNSVGTAISAGVLTVLPAPTITGFTPASGDAGTRVTITGSGFTDVTSLRLGAAGAFLGLSFRVISDTQILTTLPESAQDGPFSVVSEGGTGTSSASFGVQATRAPTIEKLEPDFGNAGSLVIIQGSGLSGAEIRFNGVLSPPIATSGTDAAVYALVPAGATTGRVRVTNSMGTVTSAQDFTVGSSPLPGITSMVPSKVRRGEVLTINGMNLLPLNTISFSAIGNVESVEVRSNTGTRLQVVVPANATSGFVYFLAPSGVAYGRITIEEPPTVSSTASGKVNESTTITLSGENFENGATVSFGGVPASSVTVLSPTQLRVTVPSR